MSTPGRRSTSRIRFNRTLFAAAPGWSAAELVAALRVEDVTLLIDARRDAPDARELELACAETDTYFARRPELASLAATRSAEPDRAHAWAAHMALRHRTCLLGDPGVAGEVADLVGMEVADLGHVAARAPREEH